MTHTLMICDQEIVYVEKLASYINSSRDYLFDARFCSSGEEVVEYIDNNDIDILLISGDEVHKIGNLIPEERIIELYGMGGDGRKSGIYKYQNCENVMRNILQKASGINEIGGMITRKNPMKILGLYSPVKRSYQSSLAVVLGQLLSEKNKTLYMNLEGYNSISSLTGVEFEKDMSDLIYDLGNGNGNTPAIIGGAVKDFGNLHLLPPMHNCKDLKSIGIADWKSLYQNIECKTDYEYIILDISDNVQEPLELLGLCEHIFTTSADDDVAKNKVEMFLKGFEKETQNSIADRIKICVVPQIENMNLKSLRVDNNQMWNCAKSLLDCIDNE